MKVALNGKVFPENTVPVIEFTLNLLKEKNYDLHISNSFHDQAAAVGINLEGCTIYHKTTDFDPFDFVISIGGDGTLLETITHVGNSEKPVLGLNTGRL